MVKTYCDIVGKIYICRRILCLENISCAVVLQYRSRSVRYHYLTLFYRKVYTIVLSLRKFCQPIIGIVETCYYQLIYAGIDAAVNDFVLLRALVESSVFICRAASIVAYQIVFNYVKIKCDRIAVIHRLIRAECDRSVKVVILDTAQLCDVVGITPLYARKLCAHSLYCALLPIYLFFSAFYRIVIGMSLFKFDIIGIVFDIRNVSQSAVEEVYMRAISAVGILNEYKRFIITYRHLFVSHLFRSVVGLIDVVPIAAVIEDLKRLCAPFISIRMYLRRLQRRTVICLRHYYSVGI